MPSPAVGVTPDIIAQLALSTLAALPKSYKPTIRSNGVPEWTILASIILSIPSPSTEPKLRLVSLGTGVKCLPTNKLPPCGDTLHDSHAEVLAKRGFGRFLLDEATALSGSESVGSEVLERLRSGESRFRMKEGVGVHLYVSALPCGNASTLYTAVHQPKTMADLKDSHPTPVLGCSSEPISTSRGRNGYTNTTSLRTKPGRPDSFPSISMSCSDKIASWNILGLQGGLLAKWFEPVYLDSIVIGGVGDAPTGGDMVGFERAAGVEGARLGWEGAIRAEVAEALYGRLESLEAHMPSPYRLARPSIHFTSLPFPFDKPTISSLYPHTEPSPHPTSIVQYLSPTSTSPAPQYISEHLFNGVDRRTSWKSPGLTPIEEKRRSGVCKLEMMRARIRLEAAIQEDDGVVPSSKGETYHEMKKGTKYQATKALLRGQVGEPRVVEGFEKCGLLSTTEVHDGEGKGDAGLSGQPKPKPPFAGWLVSGEKWESFDQDGHLGHRG